MWYSIGWRWLSITVVADVVFLSPFLSAVRRHSIAILFLLYTPTDHGRLDKLHDRPCSPFSALFYGGGQQNTDRTPNGWRQRSTSNNDNRHH